jgi:hypothetical protein
MNRSVRERVVGVKVEAEVIIIVEFAKGTACDG